MAVTHQHEAVHGVYFSSAASINSRIADEEMPCFSGLLRGSFLAERSAAGPRDPAYKSNKRESIVFMIFSNEVAQTGGQRAQRVYPGQPTISPPCVIAITARCYLIRCSTTVLDNVRAPI